MMRFIDRERKTILSENQKDLISFHKDDKALYDRLVINTSKIDDMIRAIDAVKL